MLRGQACHIPFVAPLQVCTCTVPPNAMHMVMQLGSINCRCVIQEQGCLQDLVPSIALAAAMRIANPASSIVSKEPPIRPRVNMLLFSSIMQ